ncbi:MAG: aromatic ring-hydroxylating dioxygenase subunit alpha [Alphaproteobacteria bacterium]|nr:aromatic ring-hydroxylating dioxygenase subunit alpha [Alphaproteobacteria bacterium]
MMDDQPARPNADAETAFKASGGALLRDIWYVAMTAGELRAGKLHKRMYLGEPVVMGRNPDGSPFALRDICPHRAVPLSAGQLLDGSGGGQTVECPYHGWRFGTADGVCKHIPSLVEGQPFDLEKITVRRYAVAEQDDLIWIYMPSEPGAEPSGPPPRFERMVHHQGASEGRVKFVETAELACQMDHAVIGLLDPAHTPFVHKSPLWRSSKTLKEKEKHYAPSEMGFTMLSHEPVNSPLYTWVLGPGVKVEIQFLLPGLRAESITTERHSFLGLAAITPIRDDLCEIREIMYWNAPSLDLIRPFARPFTHTFLQQDARIMKLQGEGLSHDPPLMQIPDADTLMVWYRRLKREWIKAGAEGREFENPVKPATLRWRT